MPLSASNLNVNCGWSLTRPNTGFLAALYGPDSVSFSLSGMAATINQCMARIDTIAAAGTLNIDLDAYTDLDANAVTLTKALSILILPTGTTGVLKVIPGAANGLVWFFGDAADFISIPCGSCFLYSLGPTATPQVIDATHKRLTYSNTGGTSLNVTTVLFGGT